MKKLHMESKEFRQVVQNLYLENMNLSPKLQRKVIELVNSGAILTPTLIKESLEHEKI